MNTSDFFSRFPAHQGTLGRARELKGTLERLSLTRPDLRWEARPYTAPRADGVNIYACAGKPGPLLLEAHYDVANEASENAADNTVSVCHLLALLHDPEWSGAVSFTDGEELVSLEDSGVAPLSDDLYAGTTVLGRPRYVACLELTSQGTCFFSDVHTHLRVDLVRPCPSNDAVMLRRLGVPSACVCLLPAAQAPLAYPEYWRLCHSDEDTFDKANEVDMRKLYSRLKAGLLPATA